MADKYVWHSGDNSTGDAWATAKTTLQAGLTAATAGSTVWVAHDHAETGAVALTVTAPGTSASPNKIFCVNRAGTVPPVSADLRTTATVSTTGASNITTAGVVSRCYGIIFTAGDGATTQSFLGSGTWHFRRCAVRLGGTTGSGGIRTSSGTTRTIFEDTTVQFGATGNNMYWTTGSEFIWKGTASAVTGATFPTTLIGSAVSGTSLWEGVDLTALSGKTLMTATTQRNNLILKDCKLPASFTLTSGTLTHGTTELLILRSDSGDTNYRTEKYEAGGTLTTETTIVRTGGATDGTTPVAWKIISTAAAKPEMPFTSPPIQIWNDITGSSKTLTVYGVKNTGPVPNNNDIWLEVSYYGTSGFPIATVMHTSIADELTTASALASDSSTWGGAVTGKFKMTATFTPQEKGPITIRIKVGAASGLHYVDPKVELT